MSTEHRQVICFLPLSALWVDIYPLDTHTNFIIYYDTNGLKFIKTSSGGAEMLKSKTNSDTSNLASKIIIDCAKCSGLCCVALYYAKTDGFPEDKSAGEPCKNLMADFRCSIHPQLSQFGMKGCLAYDCFGAGQKVTQLYDPNNNWKTNPKLAQEMFDVFLAVFHLHQMLWYLLDALSYVEDEMLRATIQMLIEENEQMTSQSPERIINTDMGNYKMNVSQLLKNVSGTIANNAPGNKQNKDFLGKDFKHLNLNNRDFSMSLLIAANREGCSLHKANFLGADMRDANIRNTDLSKSLFLTQMQINTAKGNANTKLPTNLSYPATWLE